MLIYGHDAKVASWVCHRLRLKPYPDGLYRAVGIINNGKLLGGVIWHNYHEDNFGKPLLIEVSIATIDKRWATRHNIRELFQYPFHQLGVRRVQATCHRKAKRVRKALKKLGFTFEGIVREAHPLGGDAAHYSILKNECFWLKEYGKISAVSSSRSRSDDNRAGSDSQQSSNSAL